MVTTSPAIAAKTSARRWPRRVVVLAFGVAALTLVVHLALPWVVRIAVRRDLAERGYPDARFTVASVGLDHMRLTDVWLADGLTLGDVELDAGIALLWRAPTIATVRHARIATAVLGRRAGGAGARTSLPVGRLRVEDAVVDVGEARIAIDGTIARPSSGLLDVDLHARVDRWALGAIVARDVRIDATGGGDAVELAWQAGGDTWTGHGTAHLTSELALRDGRAELERFATPGVPALHVGAIVAGALSPLALEVIGTARARDEVVIADGTTLVHARDARIPLWLGVTRSGVISRMPIAVSAPTAEVAIGGELVRVLAPVVALADAGAITALPVPVVLRWRAADARLGAIRVVAPSGTIDLAHPHGPQLGAWRAATGPAGLVLGEGAIDVRIEAGGVRIASGRARALGGELAIAPVHLQRGSPVDLQIAVHGLPVARVLTALHRDEPGRGVIDADLSIRCVPGRDRCELGAQVRATGGELAISGLVVTGRAARTNLTGHATRSQLVIDAPVVITAPAATVAHGDSALATTDAALIVRAAGEGGLAISATGATWPSTLRWRATEARIGDVRLASPVGSITRARDGEHTIAWREASGPWSVRAGAGELAMRAAGGRLELVRGHVEALAGELSIQSVIGQTVRVRVRGLALGRLLAAVGDGHLAGSGLVDGELSLVLDGGSPTLLGGTLRARSGGVLRVTDASWRARAVAPITGFAIQQRLLGAFAELGYTELAATIAPAGVTPEIWVAIKGQGVQTPHQMIDVDLRLDGIREAVEQFTHRDDTRELP